MRALTLLFLAFAACGTSPAGSGPAAAESVGGQDSNPPLSLLSPAAAKTKGRWVNGHTAIAAGARDYALYVPKAAAAGWPLVVMLHGCDESPASFAGGTRMNALADANHFYALYPAQDKAANALACWNWFDPANQTRGGEAAIVAAISEEVIAQYAIDPARVFVAGMSAGAALAVTMAACYPEIYAAAGVHSGLEFAAASSAFAASWAQLWGGPAPLAQGQAAFRCGSGAVVPAIVFHGEADTTVAMRNGQEAAAQLMAFNDLADDGAANGSASALVELHLVPALTHAWSGGDPSYTYASPIGPDASTLMWQFFTRHSR